MKTYEVWIKSISRRIDHLETFDTRYNWYFCEGYPSEGILKTFLLQNIINKLEIERVSDINHLTFSLDPDGLPNLGSSYKNRYGTSYMISIMIEGVHFIPPDYSSISFSEYLENDNPPLSKYLTHENSIVREAVKELIRGSDDIL